MGTKLNNQVTRAGIFETNSSSSHSISIAGHTDTPDTFPLDGDICKVYPGEFGWGIDVHHSPAMKASYCLTYVMAGGADVAEDAALMLKAVLKKETGKEVEFVPDPQKNTWDYKWGYIDHQSFDVCADVFASKTDLWRFIFNPNSWLKIDNDNH